MSKKAKFEPTEAHRKLVAVLVAAGVTIKEIALCIENPNTAAPIDKETVHKYFRTEIATARHMAMSKVVARLFSNAMQTTDIRGSNAACMFILKTQFGWRESNRPDQPDSWEGTLATKETREKLDGGRIDELSTTELANLYREADKFASGTRH